MFGGSATIDSLELLDWDWRSVISVHGGSGCCMFSSPSFSSCLGAGAAVFLRSRAARSDLSRFSSSSLSHGLAIMASNWGHRPFACGQHNSFVAKMFDSSVQKVFEALLRSYSRSDMLYFEL